MSVFPPDGVYLVMSEEDDSVLLAVRPRLTKKGIEWYDSVRDRGFHVESVRREGEQVVVVTKKATYRFEPLTVESYRRHVRARVQGELDFSDDASLRQFYLDRVE